MQADARSDGGSPNRPSLGRLLDLPYPLNEAFERDTHAERIWQVRATVVVGLVFYNFYNLSNAILMPDLGWMPTILRVGATAIAVALMWVLPRLGAVWRETLLTVAMTGVSAVPLLAFWLTRAPLGPYSFGDVFLTCVFGYTVMVLRFPAAICYTAACLAMTLVTVWSQPLIGLELRLALTLQTMSGTVFLLFANWLIQRMRRENYIEVWLRTREARELEVARRAFAALSATDPLTGIANRRRFDETIAEAHARARTGQAPYAVLMIDVDHFKRFNDAYGHPAGDACLRDVAGVLTATAARSQALVARYGGEEFVVVLRDAGARQALALALAERIVQAVEARAIPHERRPDARRTVTVSIGVASFDRMMRSDLPTAVVAAADEALYEAKGRGRNRAVLWSEAEPTALSA